jgi:8-oxo-dGTP pyrophosphatase MutT (NUDIX family)
MHTGGRHFTVAVFVVHAGRTVLHRHSKLGLLLPPGGHIEPGETPDDAARREVMEETGLSIRLLGEKGSATTVEPLTRPAGVQLEPIGPGHQHIDLIYFAEVDGDAMILHGEAGVSGLGWYSWDEALAAGANDEVLAWIRKAIPQER